MRDMHRTLAIEICNLEREHLKTHQTMAFVSPVSFAYQYMDTLSFTAISVRSVLFAKVNTLADANIKASKIAIYNNTSQNVLTSVKSIFQQSTKITNTSNTS